MWVVVVFVLQPDHEVGEMIFYLFPSEDSVYHMAAE